MSARRSRGSGRVGRSDASSPSPRAGKLRIVGGVWRRHLLPVAAVQGLRPSPDRVRETLFNWLGQSCVGHRVLDLFSGTGSLGLEAASRGASEVLFIEQNSSTAQVLESNVAHLLSKWQPDCGPAPKLVVRQRAVAKLLPTLHEPCDLILLDPPFGTSLLAETLPFLKPLLKPDGLLYIEWGAGLAPELSVLAQALGAPNLRLLNHLKAGQVHAHLMALDQSADA